MGQEVDMSSFCFEQHGAVGKLILVGDADSDPGTDFPSSLRASVREAYQSDIRVLHVVSTSGNFAISDNPADIATRGSKFLEAFAADVLASYRAIEELPVPTVASLTGIAMGGGFELLLSCDFLVVGQSAQMAFPEGQVGGIPMAGGVQRLADRVGRARAMRLVLLSETIPAKDALDLGIATHLAPDDHLEMVAHDLVQHLATGPTLAYGKMRALVRAWSSGGVSASDVINAQLSAGLGDTEDFSQAMRIATTAIAKGEPIPTVEFSGR
jgi:enoyl-CoA hydratase/carnithine racemase